MDEKENKYNDYKEFFDKEIREKLPLRIVKFRQMSSEEKAEEYYSDVVKLYKNRFFSERKENGSGLTSPQSHGLYLKRVIDEKSFFTDEDVNQYLILLIEKIDTVLHEKMGADTVDNTLLFSTLLKYLPTVENDEGKDLLKQLKEKVSLLEKELLSK